MTALLPESPSDRADAAPDMNSTVPPRGRPEPDRPRDRMRRTLVELVGCLAVFVPLLVGLLGAAPAPAAPVAAGWYPAAGVEGAAYFVGQYRSPDGVIAYCTDVERLSPENASAYTDDAGGPFVRSDGTALSAEDASALAFVLGRWGATDDDGQAAAVQLAVWSITAAGTGFDPPAMDTFLRSEGVPAEVGTRARSMVEQARDESGPYGIKASLTGDTSSPVSSEVSLEAGVVSADGEPRAGLQVSATAQGAVFADGSGTTAWTSTTGPQELPIRRTGFGPARVTLTAPTVPAVQAEWLAPAEPEVQRLIMVPATTAVTASVDLPAVVGFSPRVLTSTSAERTHPGAEIFDVLEVSAAPSERWLVDPVSGEEIGLDVVSTLWGPLSAPPVESAFVPAGTPSVGSVTTGVIGPGRYETPALTVPSAGYYVWTETIDPSGVRPAEAAPLVHPWTGRFGLVPETTLVPWEPSVTTRLTRSTAAPGDLVRDTVTARGFNPMGDDDMVQLTMYGPLEGPPMESDEVPPGTPVHSELDVPAHDGSTVSAEFDALRDPGCYTVVATFAGSSDEAGFSSAFGLPDETVCVQPPPVTAAEPPANPAAVIPVADRPVPAVTDFGAPEPRLAETGVSAALMAGVALIAVGAGMGLRMLARRQAALARVAR